MPALILDEYKVDRLVQHRKNSPGYRWDEIWNGVYVVPPIPDIWHSSMSGLFMAAFWAAFQESGHRCGGHVNVSDRRADWMSNVRCPDAVIFLKGNPARNCFTHWQGGPDLLVEVAMPGDRCREKLEFYAQVGSREALILDRGPLRIEQYMVRRERFRLKRTVRLGDRKPLTSTVVPMTFQLVRGRPRPKLKIVHTETGQEWVG